MQAEMHYLHSKVLVDEADPLDAVIFLSFLTKLRNSRPLKIQLSQPIQSPQLFLCHPATSQRIS